MATNKTIYNPSELIGKDIDNDFVFLRCSKRGMLSTLTVTEYLNLIGNFYLGGFYWDAGNLIGNNLSAELLLQANENLHVAANFKILGDAEIEVFRNVVFSSAGTVRPSINKNFISTNTTLSIITDTPTVTNYGTAIIRGIIAAGYRNAITSGEAGNSEDGFIIPQGDNILFRLTNQSGTGSRAQIKVQFTL